MIETIIALAHSLGMNAVAEGIETEEQLEQLKQLGCEYGQGYLFSKPVDSQKASKLLEQRSLVCSIALRAIQNSKFFIQK